MICFRYILLFTLVISKWCEGVKVDVQGSIKLGKDVVRSLKHYVQTNLLSGRRSFSFKESDHVHTDTITVIVSSAFLCRKLDFCEDKYDLVDGYITALTNAIENIFEGLVQDIEQKDNNDVSKTVIFEDELKRLLREFKHIFKRTNEKITEDKEVYMWGILMKTINAKFQDAATTFSSSRLEGNVEEITEVKKKLAQKLMIATTLVELKYEHTLCAQHKICITSLECSKSLNELLGLLISLPDEKVKEFVRFFYESLPNTNFYYRIGDVTGNEFQIILHDMVYSENIPTKSVFATVKKTVEDRINAVTSKTEVTSGRDVKLVHAILSDMDLFYSKQKEPPFQDFLADVMSWAKTGSKIHSPIRRVMKDISNMLSFETDDLVWKLVNEVKVFMEITVDPEK